MDTGTRDELLSRLPEAAGSVTIPHPTRVAVDGPPAAGKTTLADELAVVLRAKGREVIRRSKLHREIAQAKARTTPRSACRRRRSGLPGQAG
jgi:SpoVK/Ycf46/Vps4 family AAA+-type ATPase